MKGHQLNRPTLICLYLAAIVAANLSLAHSGPSAAIWNAFLFVGLDLTTRDRLADLWKGRLIRNMGALIATGSLLSWLLGLWLSSTFPGGPSVGRIALASSVAFGAAALADTLLYERLRKHPFFQRVCQSNTAGALVDSAIFIPLAFGVFPWTTMFAQACAKVAGGVVFASVFNRSPGDEWLERNRDKYPVWVK